jgi:hypothetical protein
VLAQPNWLPATLASSNQTHEHQHEQAPADQQLHQHDQVPLQPQVPHH